MGKIVLLIPEDVNLAKEDYGVYKHEGEQE